LAGLGISLAMEGVTEYQIYRVNKHVTDNKKAIEGVKQKFLYLQDQITTLDDKVVSFVTEMSNKVKEYLELQECITFFNAINRELDERFRQAEEITDNVLWTALTGNNNLLSTLKMLYIETLSKLLSPTTRQ
jgi:predicted RNase H-like nuclease (RuvC/YqgF family)